MEAAMKEALDRAKEAVGGSSALARALSLVGPGLKPQAISQWDKVPLARVIDVERVTGVSRHELRPDYFGAPPAEPPAPAEHGAAA